MDLLLIIQTALLYVIRGILQFLDQEGVRLTPDNISYVQNQVMDKLTEVNALKNITDKALVQSVVESMLLDKLVLLPEDVISRTKWNAAGPKSQKTKLSEPFQSVVVHRSDSGTGLKSKEECLEQIRKLQNHQMSDLGKNDIMYNFVICGNAAVYEGTGWDVDTNHAPELGRKSLGVSFLGQSTDVPTKVSVKLLDLLLQDGVSRGALSPDYKLLAHSSQCPGDDVTDTLKALPHWSGESSGAAVSEGV